MRLNESRIHFLAEQLAEELLKKKYITTSVSTSILENKIAGVIIDDLRIEDEIDQEAYRLVSSITKNIPEGSAEWNSRYQQRKEELADKRGYIL